MLTDMFSPAEIKRWWHASQWPAENVARLLFPLYAWDLEEGEIKRQVAEWGLLTGQQYSPLVTNRQLIPLLGVVDVQRFGFTSFEYEFCRMIREGKASRREWQHTFEFLEYTGKTGLFIKPMVVELLGRLGLTTEDLGIEFK